MSTQAVTGEMAKLLAARLEEHGYLVTLPPGRDPAVFKVTGLPGGPYVEVSAEDNGQAACHYTDPDEAARVIARLPVPGRQPEPGRRRPARTPGRPRRPQ